MTTRGVRILLLVAAALASCRERKPTDSIADDKAVVRDILWRLKDDRRFDEVRVECAGQAITLRGRVASKRAFEDVAAIAFEEGHGRRVDNRLEFKEK